MDHAALHARARTKGANRVVYWLVRALLQPFFMTYLRMVRVGREHIPKEGPAIIAANHRSFLDPFVLGTMARRPLYYIAKEELFRNRLLGWVLSALGAFPVRRGAADADMIVTSKALLARGEIVLIFPEGTRTRPGPLDRPHRGVGRLALETGVPVVPIAIHGTEAVRRGWRIRPHKVRVRAGRPMRFPRIDEVSTELVAAATDRVWSRVMLQWEWLGGTAAARRIAVIGDGQDAAALADALAGAGYEVSVSASRDTDAQLEHRDLVCVVEAPRAPRAPRAVLVKYGDPRSMGRAVAVLSEPDGGELIFEPGARAVVASADPGLARQVRDAFERTGLEVAISGDVLGAELAACAAETAVPGEPQPAHAA